MAIGDQLEKLAELHGRGELSDEEYDRAKDAALRGASGEPAEREDQSLLGGMFGGDQGSVGNAANRYVNFQIVSAVIGLILFLVLACAVLPNFNRPPGFGP